MKGYLGRESLGSRLHWHQRPRLSSTRNSPGLPGRQAQGSSVGQRTLRLQLGFVWVFLGHTEIPGDCKGRAEGAGQIGRAHV